MSEPREYTAEFYEYIERGASASARQFSAFLVPLLRINSVLDVGCGRGAWLHEWQAAGVDTAQGVDGAYARNHSLLIPDRDFTAVDLSRGFDLGRRFDLVTSLEVAEHLPPASARDFVSSLVAHSELVLFSAATPGQGGENHINERPLTFWQDIFDANGYGAYDVVRPVFRENRSVEPWYRFNTVLYASENIRRSLPASVISAHVEARGLREVGDAGWRARKSLLRLLPGKAITALSRWNYRRLNRAHRRKAGLHP